MAQATFHFFGELNYFLSLQRKDVKFTHSFPERASIKDTIEALGVPHPEVNSILVNGEAVDFSYLLRDGDRVEVHPPSSKLDRAICLQPPYPGIPRFVLDVHLGKLASLLRMLGFDTLYDNNYADDELALISSSQQRIVLTRDKGVLMRSLVTYGYYVRSTNSEEQLIEILRRFNLFDAVSPFQRCIRCNGCLEPVDKVTIEDRLPPRTKQEIDRFHRCHNCDRIYWQGAHYDRMLQFVESVLVR